MATPSPHDRLAEVFNRLREQPPSATADDALDRISRTLDEVEDELSGVVKQSPAPPPNQTDGRMYPPDEDYIARNADGSIRATTRGHTIHVGVDGGIIIANRRTGSIEFEQAGAGAGT